MGDIRIDPFVKVTELTVTLVTNNAPFLSTIATALDQFPLVLHIIIIPAESTLADSDSKSTRKPRSGRKATPEPAPKDLSVILPHLSALYLGWHDDISAWICTTTSGAIQWIEIGECRRSYSAPRQAELTQCLLNKNKWLYSLKVITLYELPLNFSKVPELGSLQITVASHSTKIAKASVATTPKSQTCAVMFLESHIVDLANKPLDHAEALKRPTSEWSMELVVYGWG